MLDIKEIDSYYGKEKILESIGLIAEKGFMGIIGPNGCGKTTLLRSISRVLKPLRGTVLLDGADIYELNAKDVAKDMAVVPQDNPLKFDFTVMDMVLMGRNPHLGRFEMESSDDVEIAKRAMEFTNILHLAERPVTELSGGERQMVTIARALAQEPKILLLDEPTSHLDIKHQVEILNLIKRLSNDLVVIGVFHELNLASRYCDELILLSKGKVFVTGKPEEVITAENIESVYGIKVIVKQDSGGLIVHPKREPMKSNKARVHVVCGAGTATFLMNNLVNHRYNVTAGVLNKNDTDCDTAKTLGIKVVEEKPFSIITEEKHQQNLEFVKQADSVMLTNIPLGEGNLHNLQAVLEAMMHNILVIIMEESKIEERDFTDGRATKLYNSIKSKGAVVVGSYLEGIEVLKKKCG